MKLNNKGYAITLIVFGILIVFIVVLSTLLITMNNSVKLNKTVKESVVENIQLGADTSGMSLTERIEQLELQMNNILDKTYPIGSIYFSTVDKNIEDVKKRLGGEWEVYAQGRTLVGVGGTTDENGNALVYNENQTGGSSITALSTSNIPSHIHSYTPSGIVASTFKGTRDTSESTGSGYSIGHTYSNRTTVSNGSHQHNIVMDMWGTTYLQGAFIINSTASANAGFAPANGTVQGERSGTTVTTENGSHTHTYSDYYANSISGVAAHTHYYTPSGTVTSTFTGTASNTGSVGSGTSFSVQNPYITVYMYKRIN